MEAFIHCTDDVLEVLTSFTLERTSTVQCTVRTIQSKSNQVESKRRVLLLLVYHHRAQAGEKILRYSTVLYV